MSKQNRILQLITQGKTNAEISAQIENTTGAVINNVRAAFERGQRVADGGNGGNPGRTVSVRKRPSPEHEALLIVSGRDEEAQQLLVKNKAQVIAMPELLPIARAMSKRLWGWPDLDIDEFIDVVIYNLFNACDVTLGVALDRNSNRLITKYEEETLDYAPIPEGTEQLVEEEYEELEQVDEELELAEGPELVLEESEQVPDVVWGFTPEEEALISWPEDEKVIEEKPLPTLDIEGQTINIPGARPIQDILSEGINRD